MMNLIHLVVVDGKPLTAENYSGPENKFSMLMIQFAEPRRHVQDKISQTSLSL
jgi:hypothetical protein